MGVTMSTGSPEAQAQVSVFIFSISTAVDGQLQRFTEVQVNASSPTPENDAWLKYTRSTGTPPPGEYLIFAGGRHKKVRTTETLAVDDLGVAT